MTHQTLLNTWDICSCEGTKVITSQRQKMTPEEDASLARLSHLCLGCLFFLKIYVNYFLFNNVCFLLIIKIMYAHRRKYINALSKK